ncbi:unnamed protein product [Leptosia nina]|uniref:Peptidase S1 domain-containing protein n=1 Tax=Leptosia nina TaxID=320188 RepID=A0AAV1JSS7_9NEOP
MAMSVPLVITARQYLLLKVLAHTFTGRHWRGLRENVRDILETHPGRIVSGWDASPGQFPYQASLRIRNSAGLLFGCGGSVIHQDWVITAAHCTANFVQVTVRAGLTQVHAAEYVADTWVWYNHFSFDSTTPTLVQPNDVSLVRVPYPMTFTVNLMSIQLQTSNDAYRDYSNEQLMASGWGRTWTNGPTSDRLQWTYLRGLPDSECRRRFLTVANSATICARFWNITSQSVCQGDSGGPLVHKNRWGVPTLIGITSFVASARHGGCHSGLPAGFIRPGSFHAWYQQVTGLNLDFSRNAPTPNLIERLKTAHNLL